MGDYLLRYVYAALFAGSIGALAARQVAHWVDKDPWVVRIVSYVLLGLGIVGLATIVSPLTALKFFVVAAIACPLLAWFDATCERQETEMAAERMEKFLNKPKRGR